MSDLQQDIMNLLKNLENKVVIVEGKKDEAALRELGVENIVSLNGPLFAVIETVASLNREVVILTDLDKEGKELYGKLSSGLKRLGVKIDDSFREFLFKNTKLRQIEGITTYLKHMDDR